MPLGCQIGSAIQTTLPVATVIRQYAVIPYKQERCALVYVSCHLWRQRRCNRYSYSLAQRLGDRHRLTLERIRLGARGMRKAIGSVRCGPARSPLALHPDIVVFPYIWIGIWGGLFEVEGGCLGLLVRGDEMEGALLVSIAPFAGRVSNPK